MDSEITNASLRAIRRVLRASDRSGRRLATATGLTPSQILVLQQIERHAVLTPSAIASSLQFGQATVTNILDRLENMDLVTRRRGERDRRQSLVSISEKGRQILSSAPDLLQDRFREGFEALPRWEQAMILAAVEKLATLLDADDIDAAPLIDTGIIDR